MHTKTLAFTVRKPKKKEHCACKYFVKEERHKFENV